MITVRFYGLLRLDSGMKEQQLEADTVKEVFTQLTQLGLRKKELDGCVILVNGKPAGKKQKLNNGDTVQLMSPVAGG